MKIDLSNKKVIITGGSSCIGKEVVKIFAENKAKIAIFDVNDTEGIELTNELNKSGSEIRYWHVDVRDSNQVSGGVIAAEQWLEGIDILINLAGILSGASINLEDFPDEVWESGSSKGGVHGLSLVMTDKLSNHGIRVHDILPGSVDTPMKNSQIEKTRDITGNQVEYKNIKKMLVEPEGIAKIIYFICSDEARLLKGSIRTE